MSTNPSKTTIIKLTYKEQTHLLQHVSADLEGTRKFDNNPEMVKFLEELESKLAVMKP